MHTEQITQVTHETLNSKLDHNGALLQRIHQELAHHKQLIEGAFPADERGLPDYGRHKAQHLAITKSDESMGEYKRAITMRLLQGAVGLIITILGFGLGPYFSKILGG
jgi:hypothetical protein